MKDEHEAFKQDASTGRYTALRDLTADDIIRKAKDVVSDKLVRGAQLQSPEETKRYLTVELADREEEVFACLFLDNRHRIISFEKLFFGTIDGTTVYPRVVAKRALQTNAAAVILTHNHPSGVTEPSEADRQITRRIIDSLQLIDVRVLDHIIVGSDPPISFAERGLI